MSKISATLFVGKNNSIPLVLKAGESLLTEQVPDLVPSRWRLIIHAPTPVEIDSADNPEAFVWSAPLSMVDLKPGPLLSVVTDDYVDTTLILYDSILFPDGLTYLHPTSTPDRLEVLIDDEE